ncbi:MAG: response regulator [Chloroflexi bacterium]|nr:response regulator [Chloroflexota bacterium]
MARSSHTLKPKRILLVDDEQAILDILARVLTTAGYTVDTAGNGQEALQRVACRDYDLIITNVRMPVLDGRAFYRHLCGFYPHLSQRVIFCTGDTADVATQRFLNSTGAPVIFKPFQLTILLEMVAYKLATCQVPMTVASPPVPSSEVIAVVAT